MYFTSILYSGCLHVRYRFSILSHFLLLFLNYKNCLCLFNQIEKNPDWLDGWYTPSPVIGHFFEENVEKNIFSISLGGTMSCINLDIIDNPSYVPVYIAMKHLIIIYLNFKYMK